MSDKPDPRSRSFLMTIGQQPGTRGRANKYDEGHGERIIFWASNGLFIEQWADRLDVSINTIYHWAKVHPDFAEALRIAYAKLASYWTEVGVTNLKDKDFKAPIYIEILRKRFPVLYGDIAQGHEGHLNQHVPETADGEAVEVVPPGTEARLKDDDLKAQIDALQRRRSHDAGT